ncbi:MAG TPA: hypothetical protein VMY88_00740 [Acidimicrobiales bacterium]|nr:hypothetical protein [Acidimicrobiales bacterium]
MSRWDPLFGRRPLTHFLDVRLDEARAAISKLPRGDLNAEKILAVRARARPVPLTLGQQKLDVVDASPMPRLRLEISVAGDSELWWTTPSKTASAVPDAEVIGNVLVFDQPLEPSFTAPSIKRWQEENLERLERWVGWVNEDLVTFEVRLGQEIERAVTARREVLDRLENLRRELA